MFARNKRILVIGSPVLDRIIRKGREYKQLGGISYSLWVLGKFYPEIEVIPIMNIGEPLYRCYTQWLHSLGNVNTSYIKCKGGINRNTLIYKDSEREEYMEIGQSPVREIPEKLLKNSNGIFINFITRNDVSIEEVKKIEWYNLPVYIDLHSFLRGVRSGKFVLSNKKNWKVIVQAASYLQMNIKEFQFLMGEKITKDKLMEIHAIGPRVILVTRGEQGTLFSINGEIFEKTPSKICKGDTTGCGDILGAATFAEILKGSTVQEAVLKGIEMASKKVCEEIKFPKSSPCH